jgi:proteasome lid subunit RPN8/RPN11
MQQAKTTPDVEICGVVTGTKAQPRFCQLTNRAADPSAGFVMPAAEVARFGPVLAIVHSHPRGPAFPSAHDMAQQAATALPWGIAVPPPHPHAGLFWFGGAPLPLMRRPYRHGVTDCYALVRDWFHIKRGIRLMDIPRDWSWWARGDDLYTDNFAKAGFVILGDDASLAAGDIGMVCLRSPVINHAVIWLGDGLILHHLAGHEGYDPDRLPRREPAARWLRYVKFWIRYAR